MLSVKGYRVLIKPEEIEKISAGGIIIVQNEKMEAAGQQFGTVVGIGGSCWEDVEGPPWCYKGDTILFSKYSGRLVFDPETKEEYMIMNDKDVLAVVESK